MCHFRLISRSSSWFMVHGLVSHHTRHQPLLSLEIVQITGQFISFHSLQSIHCGSFGWFGFILPLEKPFSYIHIIIVIAIVVSLISSSVTFYITVTNANANTCIGLLSTHTHNPPRFALNNNNNTQCHSKESIKVSQIKSTLNECQVIRSVDKSM